MKKNILIVTILFVIIIAIILLINYVKANGNSDEKTMQCIAENSKLIVSPTCSACAYQKKILGDYYDHFEIISVSEHPEIWKQYKLRGVPTWIINQETYAGVQSIEKLKELTGC